MSILKNFLPVVVSVAGVCASTAWASGLPFPHAVHKKMACPIYMAEGVSENPKALNFSAGEKKDENEKARGNAAGKGQNGMLLPAVKPGAAEGKLGGETDAAHGSGGGAGKTLGAIKADPPGEKSK